MPNAALNTMYTHYGRHDNLLYVSNNSLQTLLGSSSKGCELLVWVWLLPTFQPLSNVIAATSSILLLLRRHDPNCFIK